MAVTLSWALQMFWRTCCHSVFPSKYTMNEVSWNEACSQADNDIVLCWRLSNISSITGHVRWTKVKLQVNAAGHEQHMAVNLLSHALLIDVLLSSVRNATHPIRIICVSSSTAHAVHIDDTAIQNGIIHFINVHSSWQSFEISLVDWEIGFWEEWIGDQGNPFPFIPAHYTRRALYNRQ